MNTTNKIVISLSKKNNEKTLKRCSIHRTCQIKREILSQSKMIGLIYRTKSITSLKLSRRSRSRTSISRWGTEHNPCKTTKATILTI